MSGDDKQGVDSTQLQEVPAGIRGLLARMVQSPSKSLLMLGFILGLSLAGGIILWAIKASVEEELTVGDVLEALDNQQWQEARLLALELDDAGIDNPDLAGVPAYVVGAVEAHLADDQWNPQAQKIMYASVAASMRYARTHGIPEERLTHANYLLAKSLYWSGEYEKSMPELKDTALDQPPSRKAELIGYMIDVYLRDPSLSKEQALTDLRRILANTQLTSEQRDESLVHEANLLIHLDRFDEAQQTLAHLSNHPGMRRRSELIVGQMELAQAVYQAEQTGAKTLNATLVSNAIKRFETVITEDPDDPLADESRLKLADAYYQSGDYEKAKNGFAYLSRQFDETPLGIYAALKEASVLIRTNNVNDAIRIYRKALVDAAKSENQALNRWIDTHRVQSEIREAIVFLMQKNEFAAAVHLSTELLKTVSAHRPPISSEIPRYLKADALQKWADYLENQANTGTAEARDKNRQASLARHRDAGQAFYQYSLARMEHRDYPQQLFYCADHYFRGQDMIRAIKAYQLYLDTGDKQFAGQVYVRMAEAFMSMQDFERAYRYAKRTWETFPKNPVVYRARLVAAIIRQEQGKLEDAKSLLLGNIESDELTPRSNEWIESLLLYGKIQFDQASTYEAKARQLDWRNVDPKLASDARDQLSLAYQEFLNAIDSLIHHSIRTEQQGPSIHVHYMLGQAYSRAAQWPQLQSEITTINSERAQWANKNYEMLQNAYNEFDLICNHWSIFEDRGELNEFEQQLLINSYFGRPRALFFMGEFKQAMQAYQSAAARYIKKPESLEAFVQMANCQRRLNQHEEARTIISQAKLALSDRIPKDADFKETTRYSRDEWISLLDWLEQL
jgi:tetratricopeptide (TPR) repeat protein